MREDNKQEDRERRDATILEILLTPVELLNQELSRRKATILGVIKYSIIKLAGQISMSTTLYTVHILLVLM